tara:strand:+ start:5283 stop:5441 length:159 start_codon:yes stop_codon:yes gene_type:complete
MAGLFKLEETDKPAKSKFQKSMLVSLGGIFNLFFSIKVYLSYTYNYDYLFSS